MCIYIYIYIHTAVCIQGPCGSRARQADPAPPSWRGTGPCAHTTNVVAIISISRIAIIRISRIAIISIHRIAIISINIMGIITINIIAIIYINRIAIITINRIAGKAPGLVRKGLGFRI